MIKNIFRTSFALFVFLNLPLITLAQDTSSVNVQTGECNAVKVQQENGTSTNTKNCNNDMNREEEISSIHRKTSLVQPRITSQVINNVNEKEINQR